MATRRTAALAVGGFALAWTGACSPHQGQGQGTGGRGTGGRDAAPPASAWQTVYDDSTLGGSVLSAWGTGPNDVYVVGGPLGDSGFEAVVVHFDGTAWTKLSPGGTDSFWWVGGSGPKDVWMSGENGRITHWDGATFHDYPPLTKATMWGVWAASPTDAWSVGGTPEGGTMMPNDIVLHWDGSAWTQEMLPMQLGRTLYKVWGTASDDLYAVGESGTIWHRKGTTWALEPNPATSNLFTVFGCSATDVYAVGGQDVLHTDGGGTWTKLTVALGNSVNGVACNPGGEVVVVGFGGLKQRLVGGQWIDDFTSEPYGDLHGSWADGQGAFWAAGGDFATMPIAGKPRRAIIARYGAGTVASLAP
jgi:hypothetical protein